MVVRGDDFGVATCILRHTGDDVKPFLDPEIKSLARM
jgi:hypothetical protein